MDKPLTENLDWGELQNVLHGRDSKWQAIGIQLHMAHDELTKIKREHGQNLEECNREMQIAWLKSGKATWKALVAALSSGPVGLLEDAKRLEEKHLRIQPAAAEGSHDGDAECNPEKLVLNQYVCKSLLNEQLEWLVKMGFTVEDIMEWAQTKKYGEDESLNSSSNNNNITLCANSDSTQQPNTDATLLTSSALAHADPPRLQEIPSSPPSPPPPPPPPPPPGDLSPVSLSTPVDRGETQTPSGGRRKTWTKIRSRKRANPNTSQGKQPRAKRGRSSKASLMVAASSRGREASLHSPSRLSVEKSRQRAMALLKDEMMLVLEEIEQHPAAKEFIEPVSPERATDYYDVITEPMCLIDMAKKICEGTYNTPKMFCDDFDLIVGNCEAYNGAESEYTQQARELEEEFYNLVGIYFDDSEIKKQQRHSTALVFSPPREPTTSSNVGRGEENPKTPSTAGGGGSLAAKFILRGEEDEEILSNRAYSEVSSCNTTSGGAEGDVEETEMEIGRYTHSDMMAASSDDDTVGDSEDDLPSFKDIFSTPSKI